MVPQWCQLLIAVQCELNEGVLILLSETLFSQTFSALVQVHLGTKNRAHFYDTTTQQLYKHVVSFCVANITLKMHVELILYQNSAVIV